MWLWLWRVLIGGLTISRALMGRYVLSRLGRLVSWQSGDRKGGGRRIAACEEEARRGMGIVGGRWGEVALDWWLRWRRRWWWCIYVGVIYLPKEG